MELHLQSLSKFFHTQAFRPLISSASDILDVVVEGGKMCAFDALPDELIHHVLLYLSPEETLLNVSRVSKRLNRIAQTPLLWRFYCNTTFKYWQSDHAFESKLRYKPIEVNWKGLFTLRLRRNRRIAALLDNIVVSRVLRLQRIEEICNYGYDAKDFLLSQCRAPDDAEDVLARRYYACAALDSIHRSLAIEEWAKFQRHAARRYDEETPLSERMNCGMKLERALGAFDMFMLHDNEGDMDEISALLDDLAGQFQTKYPSWGTMNTRQRAVALAGWLHANNMTGLDDHMTYRYLRNCLIGRALKDDKHPSLPIISAAIFSALASRIGVEAYCCALPRHVHAIVLAPEGFTLDGQPQTEDDGDERESMFLDPYGSDQEVSLDYIHEFLWRLGIHIGHDNLLRPTATDLIVMRTAQNIRSSFTSFRTIDRPWAELIPLIELRHGDWARNLQPALYSMIWASTMMVPVLPDNDEARWDWQQDVKDLLSYFYDHFPEDSWLVEKYICPMYDTFAVPEGRQNIGELPSRRVRELIAQIRSHDASAHPPRLRSSLTGAVDVKYRVGQVFKHKRYDSHGIILGWTVDGAGGSVGWDEHSAWASGKKVQPFYRCMFGTDGSDHHVFAEESIEVVELRGGPECLPREVRDLVPMAGKFFKRWDPERGRFVSNLRELFPED